MDKKELEQKLNEEYELLGKITIDECSDGVINIDSILYIRDIMDNIQSTSSDDPIVVTKYSSAPKEYTLLDGYHRLKFYIETNQKQVPAVILDKYELKRCSDDLLGFMKKLIGKTIKFVDNDTLYVNKTIHKIQANEGCGGCNNGWSNFALVPDIINKKITVNSVESIDDPEETYMGTSDIYDLYINGIHIAHVDTGWGNGYYGGDFTIESYK